MRHTVFLFLIGAVSTSTCKIDNFCIRAIAATPVAGPRPTSADCSSFFQNYAPSTVTLTTYTSTTIAATDSFGAGSCVTSSIPAAPTIPAYATPCSGVARYSSACSCIGVEETAAPTTIAPTVTAIATSFYLRLYDSGEPEDYYVSQIGNPGDEPASFTTDVTKAIKFNLNGDGLLGSNIGQPGAYIEADFPGVAFIWFGFNDPALICSISPSSFILTCESENGFTSFGVIRFANDGPIYLLTGEPGLDWRTYGAATLLEAVPIPPTC